MPTAGKALPYVKPGDPIQSASWNDIVRQLGTLGGLGDHVDGVVNTGSGKQIATKLLRLRDRDLIIIRNDTGDDITGDHPVLGLGDVAILPSDSDQIVHGWPVAFEGDTPNEEDHPDKFVILDGPIKEGHFQTAVISGIAWVKIKNDNSSHKFATIEDGETGHLISTSGGCAQILWREDVDQDEIGWAVVRLSNPRGLTVLGPCTEYTPDVELDDTDFGIDYGSDCAGPSRYAIIYVTTVSAVANTVVLELDGADDGPPVLLTSDTFVHGCIAATKILSCEMEITNLDIGGVEVRFLQDTTVIARYQNTMYRWLPLIGGYLQCVQHPCDCATFPYDICLSVPTR